MTDLLGILSLLKRRYRLYFYNLKDDRKNYFPTQRLYEIVGHLRIRSSPPSS